MIAKYEAYARSSSLLIDFLKADCKGRVLGCWCKPKACHGDVIAMICDEVTLLDL